MKYLFLPLSVDGFTILPAFLKQLHLKTLEQYHPVFKRLPQPAKYTQVSTENFTSIPLDLPLRSFLFFRKSLK